jgi:hypothetical protein
MCPCVFRTRDAGKVAELDVDVNWSVAELRQRIEESIGIRVYSLKCKNREILDSDSLGDLELLENSVIFMSFEPGTIRRCIFTVRDVGTEAELDIDLKWSVAELRRRIEDSMKIWVYSLKFNRREILDTDRLDTLGLVERSNIFVNSQTVPICRCAFRVRDVGKATDLDVNLRWSVPELRQRVEEVMGVQVRSLKFKRREILDTDQLDALGLSGYPTIFVNSQTMIADPPRALP